MTTDRVQLLRLLAELSEQAPDLRFGQLVANVATLALGAKPEAVWDAEDSEMAAAAQRLHDVIAHSVFLAQPLHGDQRLHGWGGRSDQLAAFVPPLLAAGFSVVAPDAPGHGDSTGGASSVLAFADALEAVAARVGEREPRSVREAPRAARFAIDGEVGADVVGGGVVELGVEERAV